MAEPPFVYASLEAEERRKRKLKEIAAKATEFLAKRYWEEAGMPEGRDLEFWSKAERDIKILRKGVK